jgi:hypothetical protein
MPQLVGGLWRVDDGVSRVAWFSEMSLAILWHIKHAVPPRTTG